MVLFARPQGPGNGSAQRPPRRHCRPKLCGGLLCETWSCQASVSSLFPRPADERTGNLLAVSGVYFWQALGIAASPALRPIIGEAGRGVKPASVAFFSTHLQRRIVTRIDRMSEEFLLRPSPELTDVFVGFDDLVPQFQAVFGVFPATSPDVKVADHIAEVIEFERPARGVGQVDRA